MLGLTAGWINTSTLLNYTCYWDLSKRFGWIGEGLTTCLLGMVSLGDKLIGLWFGTELKLLVLLGLFGLLGW